jgi:hypothetical protein
MANAHLNANATYRIIPLDGGSFGIEVVVAGPNPAMMMVPFATKAAADIWIVEHKSRRSFINRGCTSSPALT